MELTIYLRRINKNCVQDSKSFVKLHTYENTHSKKKHSCYNTQVEKQSMFPDAPCVHFPDQKPLLSINHYSAALKSRLLI